MTVYIIVYFSFEYQFVSTFLILTSNPGDSEGNFSVFMQTCHLLLQVEPL